MLNWISDHFFGVAILVVVLVFGRSIYGWVMKLGGAAGTGKLAGAFCNKCGWQGKVGRASQACGKCGSSKITLRTG